jgi:hypothetical protein
MFGGGWGGASRQPVKGNIDPGFLTNSFMAFSCPFGEQQPPVPVPKAPLDIPTDLPIADMPEQTSFDIFVGSRSNEFTEDDLAHFNYKPALSSTVASAAPACAKGVGWMHTPTVVGMEARCSPPPAAQTKPSLLQQFGTPNIRAASGRQAKRPRLAGNRSGGANVDCGASQDGDDDTEDDTEEQQKQGRNDGVREQPDGEGGALVGAAVTVAGLPTAGSRSPAQAEGKPPQQRQPRKAAFEDGGVNRQQGSKAMNRQLSSKARRRSSGREDGGVNSGALREETVPWASGFEECSGDAVVNAGVAGADDQRPHGRWKVDKRTAEQKHRAAPPAFKKLELREIDVSKVGHCSIAAAWALVGWERN